MSNINRRSLLIGSVSVLASFPILAETKKQVFEYIPSKLGIDYRAMAPSPLAEMLSQGEVEWMENARIDYGEDTVVVWKDDIAPEVATGAVSQITIENLQDFTPNMLTKFAIGLNPKDTKYGYLWSIGTNQIARRLAGKPWKFCNYQNDILQLEYTSCINSMHNFDTQNIPDNWKASAPANAEGFATAKQNKLDAISKIDNSQLQKLAKAELDELEALENQKSSERLSIQKPHLEFRSDMDAIILMDNKFNQLDGFEVFANLLTGSLLSSNELEHFYDFLKEKWPKALREFRKNGFPTTRESYAEFANKFGIPTSTTLQDKQSELDTENKELYLASLPALQSVPNLPQVAELRKMIAELENLQGAEAQNQMLAISTYLVWPDGQSGELDTILTALKKKDAENTANGNPTKHFETFTRIVRDFSPDIAKRIDVFVASYNAETTGDAVQVSTYQKAIIEWAIPDGSDIKMKDGNTFIATTPEGDTIQVIKHGDHISRSYSLNGSEFALQTPLKRSDFKEAVTEYETVNQMLSRKIRKTENALSFLENPAYADIPLVDMQGGIRKTLGYSLYEKLNVKTITDKAPLITLLKTNVAEYQQELSEAKRGYEKAMQRAVAENKKHNAEADEKIKTTLKALRNSGLEFLDIDFIITNIKAGFITPDIWVPFDRQNLDLASGNFWETHSDTNNPTKHIEYIYRIANKVLTGSPDGMIKNKLVGFSLDQAILNPEVAQKTDGEVKHLLKQSGAWSETMGVDKETVKKGLKKQLNV